MPNKLNNVITRTVRVRGSKGHRDCSVLFDTGASRSFCSQELAELIGTISPLEKPEYFTIADGTQLQPKDGVELRFNLNGWMIEDDFIINPAAGFGVDEIILGISTMQKFGIKVDPKNHDIVFSLKSAAQDGARQTEGERSMNEIIKRILARMGMADIAPELTDEDGMAMILERCNRGYKAVAAPAILAALALDEKATETDARTAIEALKTLQKKQEKQELPAPAMTFAGVFAKLGITAKPEVTEEEAVNLITSQVKKPAPATAVASKAILSVLSLPETSTDEEVVSAIIAIQNPGNVVTVTQHADLEKQHREFRLNSLVLGAIQGGKLTPAEKSWAQEKVTEWDALGIDGLATLENFLAKRPKLMPIGERLPTYTKEEHGLDDATLAVARQMGVKPETMKKYAE